MSLLRNYDAAGLKQADLDHCIHPWTEFPQWTKTGSTIMVRGEGAYVWDAEGNKFIDGIGGLWFANVGFGRQELIDAATQQLAALPHFSYFTNLGNPPATELAQKLVELAPGDLNHVFFSTGGSIANDSAVRMAHFYFDNIGKPTKRLLISRVNAYHGSSYLTSALSGKASDSPGFQAPENLVHHISEANCYRMPEGISSHEEYCDYLANEFDQKVKSLGPDNVACFFAEPIMGAGGVLVAPKGYHKRMKEVCEKYDILYVSDEVVTAFGRLGHMFASKDKYDIEPDMIVTAKGITSGYLPLAATIVSDRVFEGLSRPRGDGAPFAHGFTYSGHAASCAVALANIDIIEREDICGHVRKVGPYFEEQLQTLRDNPIVGDVRGSHFMLCFESVKDRTTKEPFSADVNLGKRIASHAQERGLIVRPIGNLCVMSPALTLSKGEIDHIVELLRASIDATVADLNREGIDFHG
ncbi:MAG: aspartate aminotransferase family protein [Blastopirellula sp.]|nr:MAG: aspartate aminotransferase family protein [Blastopirellula sp.]